MLVMDCVKCEMLTENLHSSALRLKRKTLKRTRKLLKSQKRQSIPSKKLRKRYVLYSTFGSHICNIIII